MLPARKRKSTKVVYKATTDDPNWDITKGQTEVLNVEWLEREARGRLLFTREGEKQTISLNSVLPHHVRTWEWSNARGRRKATSMRMSEGDEAACIEICKAVKVVEPTWEAKPQRTRSMRKFVTGHCSCPMRWSLRVTCSMQAG